MIYCVLMSYELTFIKLEAGLRHCTGWAGVGHLDTLEYAHIKFLCVTEASIDTIVACTMTVLCFQSTQLPLRVSNLPLKRLQGYATMKSPQERRSRSTEQGPPFLGQQEQLPCDAHTRLLPSPSELGRPSPRACL